ncbi:hypothetical protein F53441_9655 [Fusarium austroafricanum]|uniref:Uncharacterized protein n=1 Tax=Fusarium austroafricanum TaxID=2364996 RepID=A0A8H4K8L4_9HYPO|nr:hypothetical protein F53441_9655 [Fusarium austroafricanum]
MSVTTSADSTAESTTEFTTTARPPGPTSISIFPNEGTEASGPLKVTEGLGYYVYFKNENSDYVTGNFLLNNQGRVTTDSRILCAYFNPYSQYEDISPCPPNLPPGNSFAFNQCQLGSNGQLDCSVQGRYCTSEVLFEISCHEERGLCSTFYIKNMESNGYGLRIGPSGLALPQVQLTARSAA